MAEAPRPQRPWTNHRGELDGALLGRIGAQTAAIFLLVQSYMQGQAAPIEHVLLLLLVALVEAGVYHLRRGQDVAAETDKAKARIVGAAEFAAGRGHSGLFPRDGNVQPIHPDATRPDIPGGGRGR